MVSGGTFCITNFVDCNTSLQPCSQKPFDFLFGSCWHYANQRHERSGNEANVPAQRAAKYLSRVARSHWRNDAINSAQFTKVFFLSSAMVAFSWEGGCSGKEEGRDCISQWSPSLSTSLTHEFHHKMTDLAFYAACPLQECHNQLQCCRLRCDRENRDH